MVFIPGIDRSRLQSLVDELELLRREIGAIEVQQPVARWLQGHVEARGAHMSTSIEGNPMTEREVRELFARHRESLDAAERENLDYRDATRFARQVAGDPAGEVDAGLLRAMHYLVVRSTDRSGSEAQWRQEQNRVADARGVTVYLPPPAGEVRARLDDLITWLQVQRRSESALVLASVAHLEFVSIHPFDDGNGRVARVLTAYLFERHGWGLRGLVSSEAAFGRDRAGYYAALGAVGDRYERRRGDLTGWCEWVLQRFAIEAATALGFVQRWQASFPQPASASGGEAARMYLELAGTLARSEFASAMRVSPATAVKQLNQLVDQGFARREGAGRATRYVSTGDLAMRLYDEAYREALARFPVA